MARNKIIMVQDNLNTFFLVVDQIDDAICSKTVLCCCIDLLPNRSDDPFDLTESPFR